MSGASVRGAVKNYLADFFHKGGTIMKVQVLFDDSKILGLVH